MSDRNRLTDALITEAVRARSSDPDLGLLEAIVRTAGTTPQRRGWLELGPVLLPRRTLLIVAVVLLLATAGAIAVGAQLILPDPVEVERMNTIASAVEAINRRDPVALSSLLAADALLEVPNVDARAGREGNVFMSDLSWDVDSFPEVWMGALEGWGLEAELGACRAQSDSVIHCAVRTRWQVLQVEIGEEWTFEFGGARVGRLVMARVDPDPPNRILPLALSDLQDWEAWLSAAHPEQADRLLPTGPDLFGHFYFRFGLDVTPDEIGPSIREYLAGIPATGDPPVGEYVCSETGKPNVTELMSVREDGTVTRASGETGDALPAGTWSIDQNLLLLTDGDGGGMSWWRMQPGRLVLGDWVCARSSSPNDAGL